MDPPTDNGLVKDVALNRLQTRGFALTTLEDIARASDLGVAVLRARYGNVEGLIKDLVSPFLSTLDHITAQAARADLGDADQLRQVIEEYLDALMSYRSLVGVVVGDPAAESSESIRLVRRAMAALRDELARGTGSAVEDKIRASSALGAVQAAVLEPTEFDPAMVRDVITDAAVAILLS